jgi:hypothetical protein
MRPTRSHEARQVLIPAAHAECSTLVTAMLKPPGVFSVVDDSP